MKDINQEQSKLKKQIRSYIQKDGLMAEEIKNPNLEFGFFFHYPRAIDPKGNKGMLFQASKPKKEEYLVMSTRLDVHPNHIKILEADKKKKSKLYSVLRKVFLLKNVEYKIDTAKNSYVISQRIFLTRQKTILRKDFHRVLHTLFSLNVYTIISVQEICFGSFKANDFDGISSLYT